MNSRRLCARILRGEVGNVAFGDLVQLLLDLDFRETSGRGSHRVFTRAGVIELVNLQVEKGDAKLDVNGQFLVPAGGQQKSQPFTCSLLLL